MKWLLRTLIGLGAILAVAAIAVAGLLWWSLPPTALKAQIPGLSAPVHIALDPDGIPRITAATDLDGAAALGFMHARDRMFQMELTRRAASGRLSEIAGAATLRVDRTMRILGLRRRAEAELPNLPPATRAMFEAYASGVNAWIAQRGRFAAPEFIPLGAPEPWTPVDSMLWGKTMALYLGGSWRQELQNAALARKRPDAGALWPAQTQTPAPDARLQQAYTRLAVLLPAFPDPFTLPFQASNEWAVDGNHSATGAPLLAGDPHLGYAMPSIWYLARIETPTRVLAGATAPGVPFLVIGRNSSIAWTFTTTGADTQDVFIETPVSSDTYQTPDGPRPYITHDETIHILGAPDQILHIRETRHGPVISDLDPQTGPTSTGPTSPILAVAMANLAPDDDAATGLLELNHANTLAEAGRAAPHITSPVQNLLAADRTSIGRFTTGRVPLRKSGDGTLPVDGADGKHDWTGFAQGDALPHEVDPPSGRLVNANERTAPPDFPVFMGQNWFGDWRAQRIRTMLDTRSSQTLPQFVFMQIDAESAFAHAVLPRLLRTHPADAASRNALAVLGRWDGSMRIDWWQPLLFNDWMRRLETTILAKSDLRPGDEGLTSDMLARALGPQEATWCGPDCDAILTATLAESARTIAPGTLWGDVHKAEFAHPILGRLPLIGSLFTWSIEQPGDDTTLFRGSPSYTGWTSVHGPAYRGVYDLADLDRSVFALTPGESGHFLRKQAGNLMHLWRSGASIRLGPTAKVDDTIELRP